MARLDPHSQADLTQGRIAEVALDLKVDFASRTLSGEARLTLENPSAGAGAHTPHSESSAVRQKRLLH